MSDAWSAPDSPDGGPRRASGVRFADLALPLVIGGFTPATVFWCANCLGVGFLLWPALLLAVFGASALVGANVRRRTGAELGVGVYAIVAAVMAMIHVLPCSPMLGVVFVDEFRDQALWIVLAFVVGSLLVGVCAVGGTWAGHALARGGALGVDWVGQDGLQPGVDRAQLRIAGWTVAGTVAFALLGFAAVAVLVWTLVDLSPDIAAPEVEVPAP